MAVAGIDLSDVEFWGLPLAERAAAFATAAGRAAAGVLRGARHRDHAAGGARLLRRDPPRRSRRDQPPARPVLLGPGRTNIPDMPAGVPRVLRLDDQHGRPPPRPAAPHRVPRRSPRGWSRDRGRRARRRPAIVDDAAAKGECDFVTDVAARLPLKIICDMMGIPASEYDFVFDARTSSSARATPSTCPRAPTRDRAAQRRAGAHRTRARAGRAARQATRRTTSPPRWSPPRSTASG